MGSKITVPSYPLPIGALKPEHYGFHIDGDGLMFDRWYRFKYDGTMWLYRKNSNDTVSLGRVTLWDRFICLIKDRLHLW